VIALSQYIDESYRIKQNINNYKVLSVKNSLCLPPII
jgi:hypothetical protein